MSGLNLNYFEDDFQNRDINFSNGLAGCTIKSVSYQWQYLMVISCEINSVKETHLFK